MPRSKWKRISARTTQLMCRARSRGRTSRVSRPSPSRATTRSNGRRWRATHIGPNLKRRRLQRSRNCARFSPMTDPVRPSFIERFAKVYGVVLTVGAVLSAIILGVALITVTLDVLLRNLFVSGILGVIEYTEMELY